MKILFVTSGTVKSNFTYRMVRLAKSMQKIGHDVAIMAPIADKYNNFIPETISEIEGVKVIQPFQFKTRRLEINLLPYILHALYLVFKNRTDLVYIYKPTPISVVGLMGKLFYGSRVVLDMDDVGSEVMKIEGHPVYQVKLVEWCERLSAYYSDAIVTASNFLNSRYKSLYPNKPVLTISNGVDSPWFKKLITTESKNRIVFMGAMNRSNIVEPLLDVIPNLVNKFPDLKVLIIGDGKFLPYFKQKVTDREINKYVEFTGWLRVEEAEKLLKAGDIGYCYMPDELTTKSASNMKVMQYMARGVLPLVSNIGDLPMYVDNGNAGYIAKADSKEDLLITIEKALLDEERIEKSVIAQNFSINNFDWDKLAIKFDDWYKSLFIGSKKKLVYYISSSLPGNFGGAEIRNFEILKSMASMPELEVELFCLSNKGDVVDFGVVERELKIKNHIFPEPKRTTFDFLKSILVNFIPPYINDYSNSGLREEFIKVCKKRMPDVVHLTQVNSYYVIKKYIPWLKKNGVKIIIDCHNIEYKLLHETSEIFPIVKKIVSRILAYRLKFIEVESVKKSDVVLVCSEVDKLFFEKYNKNTIVVPNGVDVDLYKNIKPSESSSLIFMGGTAYPPNADAVEYYIREIHPVVIKEIPDVKVYFVGTTSDWLKEKGIHNDGSIYPLGFVYDVAEYLAKSRVGISPIRYGSGTRLKIMAYMASGLPVVSTSKGAEGVDYLNGRDVIIEDDTTLFAQKIVELLRDKTKAGFIGENGRKFVTNNFDWKIIGIKINKVYENI